MCAAIIDDGRRHAHLGGIDRIAYALQRIVGSIYGDACAAVEVKTAPLVVPKSK